MAESEEKNIDTTRSCKKVCKDLRKDQIEKANLDIARDLIEAEEELERVKFEYENELENLRNEKYLQKDKN